MTECAYCGQTEGHSPRCSVTKFGVAERRFDGGDESRVAALVAENESLRKALLSIAGKRRPSGEFCQRVAKAALNEHN